MAYKTYSEKLKHPNWQKKRLEILNRDNWTCQDCGDKETTLHVHHKYYEYGREPWDYKDLNFLTLCEKCHSDEEYHKEVFGHLVNLLLELGHTYKSLSKYIAKNRDEIKGIVYKEVENG